MISQSLQCLDDHVDGAVNLRDLGGYRAGAAFMRPGLLFRSGMTHTMTPRGLKTLVEAYGVRTVVDLRSHPELREDGIAPFGDFGIAHHHVPVFANINVSLEIQQQRLAEMRSGRYDWASSYERMIRDGSAAFRRFFEVIAQPGGLPAVFHCSAGRDRTGVAAALVLMMLGVDDHDIARDYAATGGFLQPHVAHFIRRSTRMEMTLLEMARLLETSAESMHRFLTAFRAAHGTADGYLTAIGIDEQQIAGLREVLLDQRP